jgi:hypothetical protein
VQCCEPAQARASCAAANSPSTEDTLRARVLVTAKWGTVDMQRVEVLQTSSPFGSRNEQPTAIQCSTASTDRRGAVFSVQISPQTRRATARANDQRREFLRNVWRRRPDLNRGWRFCRFGAVPYVIGWPRLLVLDTSRFSLVFGRYWPQFWTQILRGRSHDSLARFRAGAARVPAADRREGRRRRRIRAAP